MAMIKYFILSLHSDSFSPYYTLSNGQSDKSQAMYLEGAGRYLLGSLSKKSEQAGLVPRTGKRPRLLLSSETGGKDEPHNSRLLHFNSGKN